MPSCPLCGISRRLILQVYAPLDNSAFHRTFYIFSCLNAPCSNVSQGWLCVRVQSLDKVQTEKETRMRVVEKIEWCTGADEWGSEEEQDPVDPNSNEENGNVISKPPQQQQPSPLKFDNRMSDEEDESNSLGSDPLPTFNNLGINNDDRNANCGQGAYAVARQGSPNRPTAEIEGGEAEVVLIDAPIMPQKDVMSLLSTRSLSKDVIGHDTVLKSFFISVQEEMRRADTDTLAEHIQELLMEYETRSEVRSSPEEPGAAAGGGGCEEESYERGVPVHGDLYFHYFLERLQENPGQVIRYSRDAAPLLIAPLTPDCVQKCQHCGCDVICELQILPTLIPKLRLDQAELAPLDFGNVLIFTCAKSCWDTPDKMRLETVIVQQEELPLKPN